MVLGSHQPDFFPWMGYFYKIFQSDVFVFSDDVQYSKTGRHNYNEILTGNGPQRFTLPIHYHVDNLNEIEIAANNISIQKMIKVLKLEYKNAPYFNKAFPIIYAWLDSSQDFGNLAQFNYQVLLDLIHLFGLDYYRDFHLSSKLNLKERKDNRIIEMCKYLGADTYISGEGAKDYHIEQNYQSNGIKLIYSDYKPLVYPQVSKKKALNMSCIDYVMNCGFNIPKEWQKIE